jgi:hypothetical protein
MGVGYFLKAVWAFLSLGTSFLYSAKTLIRQVLGIFFKQLIKSLWMYSFGDEQQMLKQE